MQFYKSLTQSSLKRALKYGKYLKNYFPRGDVRQKRDVILLKKYCVLIPEGFIITIDSFFKSHVKYREIKINIKHRCGHINTWEFIYYKGQKDVIKENVKSLERSVCRECYKHNLF